MKCLHVLKIVVTLPGSDGGSLNHRTSHFILSIRKIMLGYTIYYRFVGRILGSLCLLAIETYETYSNINSY